MVLILLCVLLMGGCTVHFKATDVELDTVAEGGTPQKKPVGNNHSYGFERIGLAFLEE